MKARTHRVHYRKAPGFHLHRNALIYSAATLLFFAASGAAQPQIGVSCALPYSAGQSDPSCVGQNTVRYTTTNTTAGAKITAELMGLDVNGNLISSLVVKNGSTVQMGSKLSQSDWKFNQNPNFTQVFAPVPLLHVTVEDQGQKAEAFCSNIPYVQMIQPVGNVVSESNGNSTNVLAAVPLTDPTSLHLYVDGVDLLSNVPNYLLCSAQTPCSGSLTVNGQTVSYSNLIVDVAYSIDKLASNTIRVTLSNLACGGQIFKVAASKEPAFPSQVSSACNVDSLSKTAQSSVFGISISDPTPGKITPLVPTPVAGQACGGNQITNVNINGKDLPVSGETFTPGNGVTTGDTYKVPINTTLDKTDLVRDAFTTHDAPLGTLDPGSNRLAVSAADIKGNRTFKNIIFATGNVAQVAISPNATVFRNAALQEAVNTELTKVLEERVEKALNAPNNAPTNTDLQNAFVVGLSASGAQTMYNQLCTSPVQTNDPATNGLTPGQIFSNKVTSSIKGLFPLPSTSISSPCSCDPTVNFTLKSVNVGTNVSCNLTFSNGKFHVTMGLPNVSVVVDALGSCEDDFLGACVDGAAVGVESTASISGIKFDFDVTEQNLLSNSTSPSVFFAGTAAVSAKDITNPFGDQGISTCGLSDVCVFLVEVFTFGQVDLTPTIDVSKVQDFSGQIGASQPDPVRLRQIKVDSNVVANFQQQESGDISEVHITPSGITAGLVGHFSSLAVDPSVPPVPGITLTPAPVPTLPVPNAKDVFIGISDDAIDMMFASLTAAGRFQAGSANGNGCVDTGITLASLLPVDCDTLGGASDTAAVAARAYCHAIKGDNCSTLKFNDPSASLTDNAKYTSQERGICWGAQGVPAGQTCLSVSNLDVVEATACGITSNLNLRGPQKVLFCAKGDVPPRMLFPDTNTGTLSSVPAVLRIPSLSVELVIDRDGNGQAAGAFVSIPACFGTGTPNNVDCSIFASCLDLNLDFTMAYQTCPQDGKPGFNPMFQDVQVVNRQLGTICGGSTSPTTDSAIIQNSSNTQIITSIGQNGAAFAPPMCGVGLDLGGFVKCASPGILSIRSEPTFIDSRDYLAITCAVQ